MPVKVAVLGLGLMGGGMARVLVVNGFTVSVWNRDPAKAEPLAAMGARVARSAADAVAGAEVVVAMLADDAASRAVWLDGGALDAMGEDAVLVESSTLTVAWVRELAAAAEARGTAFLDAPVTGSREQAATGALRFIVGGAADTLDRVRPVLQALGNDIVHLGPVGSGATLKLVNNFLCGVQVASLAEAVAMVEASGLDPERAVDLLASGAPGSPLVKAVSRRMLARDYAPHFYPALMAKDLTYAAAAAGTFGIDLASAGAARQRFDAAASAGYAERDIAAIVEPLRAATPS